MDIGFGSVQLTLFDKDTLVTTQNLALGRSAGHGNSVRGCRQYGIDYGINHRNCDNELSAFRKIIKRQGNWNTESGANTKIFVSDRKGKNARTPDSKRNQEHIIRNCFIWEWMHCRQAGSERRLAEPPAPRKCNAKCLEMTGAENECGFQEAACATESADYAEKNRLVKFNPRF